MAWGDFQLVSGVVARLRLVFLSVSLLLITVMFMGYLQLGKLNKTTDDLMDASVPLFIAAQNVERNLTGLALSLQAIDNVRSLTEMPTLDDTLRGHLRMLTRDIDHLTKRQSAPDIAINMAESLDAIDTNLSHILELRRDLFGFERSISRSALRLRENQNAIRSLLAKPPNMLSSRSGVGVSANVANPEQFTGGYASNLPQGNVITELMLRTDALVGAVTDLGRNPALDATDRIERELRSRTQMISGLIGQIQPGSQRTILTDKLGVIDRLIFGDTGILRDALRIKALRSELDQKMSQQSILFAAISNDLGALTTVARTQVGDDRKLLGANANQVIILLMMASFGSLLAAGVANILIVKRYINKRMSRLTTAVSAIAANESHCDADMEADDKGGEMALALATFRHTAEELRRSNVELENFAYVAAHDLRSPLRAIQDLAEWTMKDAENQFSDEGRANMILLQSRVDRLNRLLSDLLAYSRVGKESQDLAVISLPQMVGDIQEMLDSKEKFQFSYDGTPVEVTTYATPLRQILLNLISNSIKHHDKARGTIRVSAEVFKGRLRVRVEDDGPGIDLQYHDRVFGLFQTLRPRDEVEGSGLGLAIIRKLVGHYGGTIRLSSDPKATRGSRFEFDLPAIPSAAESHDMAA